MSGKHGPIGVGGRAKVVNDVNLPLEGDGWFNTAIGKSVVIHTPDGGADRMACANIEAEKEIVKTATIAKNGNRSVVGSKLLSKVSYCSFHFTSNTYSEPPRC